MPTSPKNLEEGDHDFDGAKNPLTVKELKGLNDEVEAKESDIEAKADSKPETANPDFANMSDDDKLNHYLEQMRAQLAQPKGKEGKKKDKAAPAQELPDVAKVGPLSVEQRLSFITSQMKIGIEAWWNENKGWVIPTVIGVILGVTALIVVTGGAAIMPILSALMQGLTVIFGAMLVAQIAAPLKDYIVKAWKGDKKGASQSLAQAFAVGLTEIIFNLIFKGLGKLFKLIGKGAKAAMRGMKKLAQSTVKLTKRLGRALIKGGKVIFKNLKIGSIKGIKKVKQLTNTLTKKFRLGLGKIRVTKQWIIIELKFNPRGIVIRIRNEFKASGQRSYFKELDILRKKIRLSDAEFEKLVGIVKNEPYASEFKSLMVIARNHSSIKAMKPIIDKALASPEYISRLAKLAPKFRMQGIPAQAHTMKNSYLKILGGRPFNEANFPHFLERHHLNYFRFKPEITGPMGAINSTHPMYNRLMNRYKNEVLKDIKSLTPLSKTKTIAHGVDNYRFRLENTKIEQGFWDDTVGLNDLTRYLDEALENLHREGRLPLGAGFERTAIGSPKIPVTVGTKPKSTGGYNVGGFFPNSQKGSDIITLSKDEMLALHLLFIKKI
ncbi:hypothetical protein [uncultured Microscilla sp.]|uniref:hypothetical protein n=1 Tax=uncultured Microscilla sp. TaxID=432653 RepID=UPI00260C735B|nr:hypothetical protein [uncultured Microscilla sp.]